MCRAVKCGKCGKTTWAGCGAHVDQVMAGVPQTERCRCNEAGAQAPKAEGGAPKSGGGLFGFFKR